MADRCEGPGGCWHALDFHQAGVCRYPGCGCGKEEARVKLPTWGVVPTKNRPTDVRDLVDSLGGQIHGLIVVDNNDEVAPSGTYLSERFPVLVLHRPGYPPNLSALLNMGADQAAACQEPGAEWNLCFFNDDLTVPPGWAVSLEQALRSTGAALAYTDRLARSELVFSQRPPTNHSENMTGWACMVRGELGIRWDEQFRWWYGDNDLDLRCRLEYGGVVAVPGPAPDHRHPSEQTFADATLSAITHEDGARFNQKWAGRV